MTVLFHDSELGRIAAPTAVGRSISRPGAATKKAHGEIGVFQPGIAMMAVKLRLPVVPVRLEGLDRVLHQTQRFPRRGTARVSFGRPLDLDGSDYAALARRVELAVRQLGAEPGEIAVPVSH